MIPPLIPLWFQVEFNVNPRWFRYDCNEIQVLLYYSKYIGSAHVRDPSFSLLRFICYSKLFNNIPDTLGHSKCKRSCRNPCKLCIQSKYPTQSEGTKNAMAEEMALFLINLHKMGFATQISKVLKEILHSQKNLPSCRHHLQGVSVGAYEWWHIIAQKLRHKMLKR